MAKNTKFSVVSLFSGVMGLDLGFENEKFKIKLALDINNHAVNTIKLNRPNIPVIHKSIFDVKTETILSKAGLQVGEADVITGGPPCQPFSTAGKRLSIEEKEGKLVFQFIRVIKEAQPKFFIFENVAGLLSAACKHISFYKRIKKKKDELKPEERLGSAFELILEEFNSIENDDGNKYGINYDILNSADYGVPQKRRRLIMIGSRNGEKIPMPKKTHGKSKDLDVISGQKKPWVTLKEGLKDLNDRDQEYLPFPKWGKYMKYIPEGGCWRDLPKDLHEEALLGAYDPTGKGNKGGRTGFYRRLSWDKPSPTLLTSPNFKGSVLRHPNEHRPLSIAEYARIQGFPDDWKFVDGIAKKYRLIGEAVPVPLSQAIAKQIKLELKKFK